MLVLTSYNNINFQKSVIIHQTHRHLWAIVYKMWTTQYLTTLRPSMACYSDSLSCCCCCCCCYYYYTQLQDLNLCVNQCHFQVRSSYAHHVIGTVCDLWYQIVSQNSVHGLEISGGGGYFTTDGRSDIVSWYRAPLGDLRPDITSCWNVAVWNLWMSKLLYGWWSVSQCVLVSSTLVGLATRYYFLSDCRCLKFTKVKVTLRLMVGQTLCLGIEHPCGTCNQILLPVGMSLSEISGDQSYFTTDGQSVSQCVLVSSTLGGLATRYYFLSGICGPVSVGRPLWRE
jgi:hypothetical protein